MSEARTYRQLLAVGCLWLVCVTLFGLGVAGCMTERQRSAKRRARFEAMMNDTNQMEAISERSVHLRKELKPLDPFWRGESTDRPEQSLERDIQDLRRANLEKLRKLK